MMEQAYADYLDMALRLGSSWLAGSLIGLERSFHGRPAGFRTHALVCLASAALTAITASPWRWLGEPAPAGTGTDPARMAAGIMTGVGFLGAGVIFREHLTVRGLTTAASIWMTAALGIVIGFGLLIPGACLTVAAFLTLTLFRWIEAAIPSQAFARLVVRFVRSDLDDEQSLRRLIAEFDLSVASVSYRLLNGGDLFEYAMVIRGYGKKNFQRLAFRLLREPGVKKFTLTPMGE